MNPGFPDLLISGFFSGATVEVARLSRIGERFAGCGGKPTTKKNRDEFGFDRNGRPRAQFYAPVARNAGR